MVQETVPVQAGKVFTSSPAGRSDNSIHISTVHKMFCARIPLKTRASYLLKRTSSLNVSGCPHLRPPHYAPPPLLLAPRPSLRSSRPVTSAPSPSGGPSVPYLPPPLSPGQISHAAHTSDVYVGAAVCLFVVAMVVGVERYDSVTTGGGVCSDTTTGLCMERYDYGLVYGAIQRIPGGGGASDTTGWCMERAYYGGGGGGAIRLRTCC